MLEKERVSIYLEDKIKKAAKEAAIVDNRSLSSWINTIIKRHLKQESQKDSPQ